MNIVSGPEFPQKYSHWNQPTFLVKLKKGTWSETIRSSKASKPQNSPGCRLCTHGSCRLGSVTPSKIHVLKNFPRAILQKPHDFSTGVSLRREDSCSLLHWSFTLCRGHQHGLSWRPGPRCTKTNLPFNFPFGLQIQGCCGFSWTNRNGINLDPKIRLPDAWGKMD